MGSATECVWRRLCLILRLRSRRRGRLQLRLPPLRLPLIHPITLHGMSLLRLQLSHLNLTRDIRQSLQTDSLSLRSSHISQRAQRMRREDWCLAGVHAGAWRWDSQSSRVDSWDSHLLRLSNDSRGCGVSVKVNQMLHRSLPVSGGRRQRRLRGSSHCQ